ncbi:hypothetical protein MK372_01100, partial [Streptococcus oralis]
RAQ